MKICKVLLAVLFLNGSIALALDEADIPPPPMPDYMVGSEYDDADRGVASVDPVEEMEKQEEPAAEAVENVKQEFLQAAEEIDENATVQPDVEDVVDTTPLEELKDEPLEPAQPEVVAQEVVTPEPKANVEPIVVDPAPVEEQQAQKLEQAAIDQLEENQEVPEEIEEVWDPENSRQPTSQPKPFKPGMYTFAADCTMQAAPDSHATPAGTVKAGKKLWVDKHDESWHKVYKKSGAVYISAECL